MDYLLSVKAPLIANLSGILLCVIMLVGARKRFRSYGKQYALILGMVLMVGIYCVLDLLNGLLDGVPGKAVTVVLYTACSLDYLINVLLEMTWVKFVAEHVGVKLGRSLRLVMQVPVLVGIGLLVANLFDAQVFSYRDNIYRTEGRVAIFGLIVLFYFACALVVYRSSRHKGGALKYFPIWEYMLPSFFGMVMELLLQTSFMGLCNAIAISAVLSSLMDERIFRDSLTGLYNRSYLEEVKSRLEKQTDQFVSGIMLDLNIFKGINDTYGHAEGDRALVNAAGIIKTGVGSYGDVIRYAGDEFIALINTWEADQVLACTKRIEEGFHRYNEVSGKPYELSVSMGYAVFDTGAQSVNEFLNTIDKKMYLNKQVYYQNNPADRRKQRMESDNHDES
ncbi:MAG: GGDEF domain-containing protein [Lachnospiraceae bacterium]|nr:GGDEF domain-containing protein [Lachnospiraceae bacterium]